MDKTFDSVSTCSEVDPQGFWNHWESTHPDWETGRKLDRLGRGLFGAVYGGVPGATVGAIAGAAVGIVSPCLHPGPAMGAFINYPAVVTAAAVGGAVAGGAGAGAANYQSWADWDGKSAYPEFRRWLD